MTLQRLESIDAVIEALGGVTKVANLTEKTPQAVSNWRRPDRGGIAPDTFIVMTQALAELGYDAPPELWGIRSVEPAPAEATAP